MMVAMVDCGGSSSYNGSEDNHHEDTNGSCEGMVKVLVKMMVVDMEVLSVVLVMKMLIDMSCYN